MFTRGTLILGVGAVFLLFGVWAIIPLVSRLTVSDSLGEGSVWVSGKPATLPSVFLNSTDTPTSAVFCNAVSTIIKREFLKDERLLARLR